MSFKIFYNVNFVKTSAFSRLIKVIDNPTDIPAFLLPFPVLLIIKLNAKKGIECLDFFHQLAIYRHPELPSFCHKFQTL